MTIEKTHHIEDFGEIRVTLTRNEQTKEHEVTLYHAPGFGYGVCDAVRSFPDTEQGRKDAQVVYEQMGQQLALLLVRSLIIAPIRESISQMSDESGRKH